LSDLHIPSMSNHVKIRGNPDLFKRYSLEGVTPHVQLAGGLKNYLNIQDYDKNTAWEYDASLKLSPKNASTVIANHIEHRKYIDKQAKIDQQTLDNNGKVNKSAEPTVNSFIGGATWVKINIYGPSDYPFNEGETSDFRTQLFYDGYYMLSHITNTFDRGVFTQDLEILAIDSHSGLLLENPADISKK
jgi:hypothetical protein